MKSRVFKNDVVCVQNMSLINSNVKFVRSFRLFPPEFAVESTVVDQETFSTATRTNTSGEDY
jgi:hypothetical protein